jgi:hypothetical protein
MPRVRFTLRHSMGIIALAGIGAWGWRLVKLEEDYRGTAKLHRVSVGFLGNEAQTYRTNIENLFWSIMSQQIATSRVSSKEIEQEIQDAAKGLQQARDRLAANARLCEHHHRLMLKYDRAALYPWLPVEPDPPEPK